MNLRDEQEAMRERQKAVAKSGDLKTQEKKLIDFIDHLRVECAYSEHTVSNY